MCSSNGSISLLAVGLPDTPTATQQYDLRVADSGRQALAMLRLMYFDLLLVGDQVPDMSVWSLIRTIRMCWPQQRWALVASHITPREEIVARSLGALMVIESVPNCSRLHELAASLLGRQTPATLGPVETGTQWIDLVKTVEV